MRVTNSMMMNSMTQSLQKKAQNMVRLSDQISTGKKISKPSDNPVGMAMVMDYQNTISKIEQYGENIDRGKTQLEVIENILKEIENQIISIKQVATEQSAAVLETRDSAVEQVENSLAQIVDLANSKLGNNYLFGGHQTNSPPIVETGGIYSYDGDNGEQGILIGDNSRVRINTTGDELFTFDTGGGNVDFFQVVQDLMTGLEDPSATGTQQVRDQLELLEAAQEQINSVRTRNAGTYERLETTKAYWDNFKVGIEEQLSKVQDVDVTKTVVALQNEELMYETTMALTKEIIQNSLLSFLR